MTDLSARLERLTPAQRALLDRRLADRQAMVGVGAIPRRERRDRARLTDAQERVWLHRQRLPDDPAHNVPSAWRLHGRLDLDALTRAVHAVMARHEVLRSTYELDGDQPVQVVHPHLPFAIPTVDLRDLPAEQREERMWQEARAEGNRPFDLGVGPLLRMLLIRLADDEQVLVRIFDHMIWDRASMGIFGQEVAGFYRAYVEGGTYDPPPLPIQYGDYAEWQPQWIEREVRVRHLPYWRRQLADVPPARELPTDHPERRGATNRSGQRYFRLSPELTEELRRFAHEERTTLNVVLLAVWKFLLHRLTGAEDVVVGTNSSTRRRAETEPLMGLFLTMLPLRTTVRSELTFRELVAATRRTMTGALDHHDIPIGVILDELNVGRGAGLGALYRVAFIMVDFRHEAPLTMAGLELEPLMLEKQTVTIDLSIGYFDEADQDHVYGMIEYNADLFTADTIERMWQQLDLLLHGAVATPDLPMAELPTPPGDGDR
ncbi:condensation domain-containing protein [Micromonospora echinospora]|uniref:condensation domain-containing protein n=1 Tax=Micromonospora echinospora TaxID=1877 RepID=UPI003671FE80